MFFLFLQHSLSGPNKLQDDPTGRIYNRLMKKAKQYLVGGTMEAKRTHDVS